MPCLAHAVLLQGKDILNVQVTSENHYQLATFKLWHRCEIKLLWHRCEIKLSSGWINRLMKACVALRVPCFLFQAKSDQQVTSDNLTCSALSNCHHKMKLSWVWIKADASMCCPACTVLLLGKGQPVTCLTYLTYHFQTVTTRWNCHQFKAIGWWKHALPCVYRATPTSYTSLPPAAESPVAARFGLERVGRT